MKTQVIPYCANTGAYKTGIDIMNAGDTIADAMLTYRGEDGKLLLEELYKVKPWAHKTFKPNLTGRFSVIIESSEGIIVTRILTVGKEGLSECSAK